MTFVFPLERQDQNAILACGIVFTLLSVVVVGLRVLARRKANRLLDASDYLIITSCIVVVAYQAIVISSVLVAGLGFHVEEIKHRFGIESGSSLFFKLLIPMQVLWAVSLALCRISIIHLFSRIFVVQSFIIIARATYVLIALWALAAIFTAFLICQPFPFNWDKTIEGGTCGDAMASWITTGALNMVSDLIILIMPIPYILGLELALPKRLILASTFGVGILTCVISLLRITSMTTIDFYDVTYTISRTILFSALEPCVAVILACVITLRPLFGGQYLPDGTATFSPRAIEAMSRRNPSSRHFKQLNDESETRLRPEEVRYQTYITKSPEPFAGLGSMGEGLEMGSISIKHEWTVQEERRPTTSDTNIEKKELG
ncbi:uncharacterized protein F4822DRAFT_1553 [Hypoxylon trugodes]|uniref:uncharacterized protein n=1 Tax=Hypoxylon trugodes TaxID=326681 RepID=UPI00219C757D|nr:uncharacterized protein F4822DRAFT_1553 [Hypoxylon trugodes]KAI1393144.1 hypothetical protein F4822DRAFT_1553 [Hypoxylon trugodes]